MRKLQYVSTFVDVGGGRREKRKNNYQTEEHFSRPKRSRLRLHRTNVARRVRKLATRVRSLKADYLMKCRYIGLMIDEGNNFRRSCPLYAAVITCDDDFYFRIQYIGQADSEGKKNGKAVFEIVRKIFVDADLEEVWKRIMSAGTDGAAVMRSTAAYSGELLTCIPHAPLQVISLILSYLLMTGLDCRGLLGTAFSAFMKRRLKSDLDFWHCATHQFNLSLNDTLNALPVLKSFFIAFLRMCYSEFKRSSKNRAMLKTIKEELHASLNGEHNWKMFYPLIFCLTRWIGLLKCAVVLSKKNNRLILKRYAQKLRDDGFGARPFNPYRYHRRRRRREAAEAGGDDRDGDVDSSDSNNDGSDAVDEHNQLERVREAYENDRLNDGYQVQQSLFPTIAAAATAAPTQEQCVRLDGFDTGNPTARGRKRKNLLNENVGLSDLNFGRAAYLAGILKPYKILVEELQNNQTAEQHLFTRRVRKFYMVIQNAWIGTDANEPMYASQNFWDWVHEMETLGKQDLVAAVKKEARVFASIFVLSVKRRLSSTWNYIQCLELIDPLGPELATYATPAVWTALRDLYGRRKIEDETGQTFDDCRDQILSMRAEAPGLDPESKSLIRSDLCVYLRERRARFRMMGDESPTPAYDAMCAAIFSIPLSCAFVESLFSKMTHNQSKIRGSLEDDTMSSILHIHDVALANPQQPLTDKMRLKILSPVTIRDKLRMNKNVGTVVCDIFDGERYHGEVRKVIYHDVHAQYMYRVVYSDGDSCDYWRHELEMVKCRCETTPDSDS